VSFSLKMKLPSVVFLALLWCGQAIAILPLGAQFTEQDVSAIDGTTSLSSTPPNTADEVRLKPDGVNTSPGWALDRIGEKFSADTATPIYSFPDTTNPVRLYLIDTAVRNPGSFLTANPNLKSLEIVSLSGASPAARDHGTQMLSLIAGMGTGIATGTPIHVINYDIYADSPTADPTTDVTNLVEAIAEAVMHSRLPETVPMRSVICIATSSGSSAFRTAIDSSIDAAVAAGIPVIVSAGNLGADAASYTPPSNGIKNGVICVGASDGNNLKIPMSNYGAPVDILAPGYEVSTRSESATSPIVAMTGSSPATALVAGAVLAKLSASPTHTPAGIESSLKAASQAATSGPRLLRSIVAPSSSDTPPDIVPDGPLAGPISLGQAATPVQTSSAFPTSSSTQAPAAVPAPPALDSDSDGIPDIVETFHGAPQGVPPSPVLSLDAAHQIQFKFPIDQDLLDGAITGNTFVLRNGYSWKIRCSSDFSNWSIPTGILSKSTDTQGQAWLTASFPAGTQPSCFARIEIVAP
jgi:hypothetical protein